MSDKGELDLTGAKQNTGMWLVKVPKYLSQQWSKASGRGEVGKLRIVKHVLSSKFQSDLWLVRERMSEEWTVQMSQVKERLLLYCMPENPHGRTHYTDHGKMRYKNLRIFAHQSIHKNQSEEKSESGSAGEYRRFI
ncbi:hypothetical protein DUI87_16570 [Hirundo rustica rustica]|uniref:TFIIF beta subunit N-terminal domain-containing protein n=1 Tax=Hirundo rustica rustica TaxID=333673 RepID=A0A3M0K740_HIRRU|nr:hypothetical protein DUI87_16570 [Hirundo rustica rustica]